MPRVAMNSQGDFEVIRDPLWNNIRLDSEALQLLDSEPFQRLRYVRQLGHAFLVYPGATHTRFEHALGTYHLTRRVLSLLAERGELDDIDADERRLVTFAALLHDIGHYPFSHSLEEAGLTSHEVLAREQLAHPGLASVLAATGIPDARGEILRFIDGSSTRSLRGLISGSLDLDKIDYLTRDARMCGVPYGTVDVDRLIHSITLVSSGGAPAVGIHEKGVSALESLLFAKYQMYRNVYWHHGVRSATAMFKRLTRDAIASGTLNEREIGRGTDDSLMESLRKGGGTLYHRLRHRQLYKRALDLPGNTLAPGFGDWIAGRPDLCQLVEDDLANQLGLGPGELLLDLPCKPAMLASNLPVMKRDGSIVDLGTPGGEDLMGLQGVADQLYLSARRLRVFVAAPRELAEDRLISQLETLVHAHAD